MRMLATTIITFLLFLTQSAFGQYKVGDIATDFSLKNVDMQMVSMGGLEDIEGVILTFTCNTCPVSVAYEDRIIALDQKYRDLGYPVVAINPNNADRQPGDSFAKMLDRAENKGFTFPYLEDPTQEITKAYGATKTPHVFILQKNEDDQFIVKYIGAIDNNMQNAEAVTEKYVENAVDQLKAGEEVSVSSTKAIGCGIKWAVN